MAKQKVNPLAIGLIIVALALAGVVTTYLINAYAPSNSEKGVNEFRKNLEEIRKDRK